MRELLMYVTKEGKENHKNLICKLTLTFFFVNISEFYKKR
jgi:hypothetical protein